MDHQAIASSLSELLSCMYGKPIVHDAFRTLDGDEGPLLLIDDKGYHLIWIERGQEGSRRTTQTGEEMIFRILADFAFSTGSAYEFSHRIESQDPRRIIHAQQRALFGKLEPRWAAMLEAQIVETLRQHPYIDRV
jgi:Immunity protein 63